MLVLISREPPHQSRLWHFQRANPVESYRNSGASWFRHPLENRPQTVRRPARPFAQTEIHAAPPVRNLGSCAYYGFSPKVPCRKFLDTDCKVPLLKTPLRAIRLLSSRAMARLHLSAFAQTRSIKSFLPDAFQARSIAP